MPESVDAGAIRRWCAVGLEGLRQHQVEIDELNVYPVPDGDTGTNLVLTMSAASRALLEDASSAGAPTLPGTAGRAADDAASPLGLALRRLARGGLLGARGSSGVILAQLLRGLADALVAVPAADGHALAKALELASVSAYQAVAVPVEGTMLTVAAVAAAAAGEAGSADVGVVVTAAARAAWDALARTPEQLPELARAGVVDAGGRGLVILFDALVEAVTGKAPPVPVVALRQATPVRHPAALLIARESAAEGYAYEVQYLLDAEADAVERLRERLRGLGDSLVIVGSEGAAYAPSTWNVHVHVNDVGAAIEAGVTAGRPYQISVTRFADQMGEHRPGAHVHGDRPDQRYPRDEPDRRYPRDEPVPVPPGPGAPGDRAVVVVSAGGGLRALFAAEGGVTAIDSAGSPSTAEILDAVLATGSTQVVVLPNDGDVTAVADAAAAEARAAGVHAAVVPTHSPVQGLAALAVRDPGRRFEDDVIAMAEAAGACRYAEVTVAVREALTVVGRCQAGDVLALVDGEVNLIGRKVDEVGRLLLDRLLAAGGELVTLVTGEGAPPDLAGALCAHLRERWPFVEAQCFEGRQPHYPLLVGVE